MFVFPFGIRLFTGSFQNENDKVLNKFKKKGTTTTVSTSHTTMLQNMGLLNDGSLLNRHLFIS